MKFKNTLFGTLILSCLLSVTASAMSDNFTPSYPNGEEMSSANSDLNSDSDNFREHDEWDDDDDDRDSWDRPGWGRRSATCVAVRHFFRPGPRFVAHARGRSYRDAYQRACDRALRKCQYASPLFPQACRVERRGY